MTFVEDYYAHYQDSPSITKIADKIGMARSTVYRYLMEMKEKNMIFYDGKTISTMVIEKSDSNMVRAAFIGSLEHKDFIFSEENIESYILLPESIFGEGELYLFYAEGDSMNDVGIDAGDLVIIRKQTTAENDDIVLAFVEQEMMVKRFCKEKEWIKLYSENPEEDDIITKECAIQGVAVNVIKSLQE